jgi:hypothetical protein
MRRGSVSECLCQRAPQRLHSEGEFSASQQLANAAAVIASQPATLQLRYLQTLTDIAAEKNSTIIFPLPIDLIQAVMDRLEAASRDERDEAGPRSMPPHAAA